MTGSSTQVKRALSTHCLVFSGRLADLVEKHQDGGAVEVAYRSDAFTAGRPREAVGPE